jgi:hypothetical protein
LGLKQSNYERPSCFPWSYRLWFSGKN